MIKVTVSIELEDGQTLQLTEHDMISCEFALPKEYGVPGVLLQERFELRAVLAPRPTSARWVRKQGE